MKGGIELSVLPTIWQTLALQTKGQTDKNTFSTEKIRWLRLPSPHLNTKILINQKFTFKLIKQERNFK